MYKKTIIAAMSCKYLCQYSALCPKKDSYDDILTKRFYSTEQINYIM